MVTSTLAHDAADAARVAGVAGVGRRVRSSTQGAIRHARSMLMPAVLAASSKAIPSSLFGRYNGRQKGSD